MTELRRDVAVALADAWISAIQRLPRFDTRDVEKGDLAYLGAQAPEVTGVLAWVDTHVVHPWRQRRKMLADARSLGITKKRAVSLLERFRSEWRSGRYEQFARAEQAERLAEAMLAG